MLFMANSGKYEKKNQNKDNKKKEKDFIKYVSRPTYTNYDIFGKRLATVHKKKELLTLNKPIYVGCTV